MEHGELDRTKKKEGKELHVTNAEEEPNEVKGIDSTIHFSLCFSINRLSAESSTSTCDQTYGFLPCTTSVIGNLFLMVVYGYLMFFAAKSLTDGCELLLEILGPGIVAGLVLPILGALPDAMLVLVVLNLN
ncbi:sodium/calcium exchanger ncl [Quercus suber]|uniref:Sodium/calcium exchanger ncl n=1 Tax=Quercus suber TaxID=58331 RepID=A0AAW0M2Q9_QUESU